RPRREALRGAVRGGAATGGGGRCAHDLRVRAGGDLACLRPGTDRGIPLGLGAAIPTLDQEEQPSRRRDVRQVSPTPPPCAAPRGGRLLDRCPRARDSRSAPHARPGLLSGLLRAARAARTLIRVTDLPPARPHSGRADRRALAASAAAEPCRARSRAASTR